jgi:hypothetical protein
MVGFRGVLWSRGKEGLVCTAFLMEDLLDTRGLIVFNDLVRSR